MTALRHQVGITWLPTAGGAALLVAGALLGGWKQTLLFAGALLVEGVGAYLTSRHGNWRLRSPEHLTERHGLFIILAIGESIVAAGFGAADKPISAPLLLAACLGVATAVCLWWLYFDMVSVAGEQRLVKESGQARVDLAVDAYTYTHYPIVGGIVLTALGVEGVLAYAGQSKPLGAFYALALFGGLALYLIGHLLFRRRMHGVLSLSRLVAVCVLVASLPAAAAVPALVGQAGAVVILAVLIVVETARNAQERRIVRGT